MKDNPFATLEAAIIIGAIIQVIVLIVFFTLANNVSKIKKLLNERQALSYVEAAEMEAYLGNNQAAIENYKRAKYRYEKKEVVYKNDNDITKQVIADIDKAINAIQNNLLRRD